MRMIGMPILPRKASRRGLAVRRWLADNGGNFGTIGIAAVMSFICVNGAEAAAERDVLFRRKGMAAKYQQQVLQKCVAQLADGRIVERLADIEFQNFRAKRV